MMMLAIDTTIAPEPETQLPAPINSYSSPNLSSVGLLSTQGRQDLEFSRRVLLTDAFEKDYYESGNTAPAREILVLSGSRSIIASSSEVFMVHAANDTNISSTVLGEMYLWPGCQLMGQRVVHQISPSDHNVFTYMAGGAIGKLGHADQDVSWKFWGSINVQPPPVNTFNDTADTYGEGTLGSMTSLVMQRFLLENFRKIAERRNPKPMDLADLQAALEDLDGVTEEAREDGYPDPTPQAIENVRLLVKIMYDIRPMRYDIYPMDDGEVVIDGGDKHRIGVFCYPDGSVLYIGWADGKRVRIRRSDSKDIPHEFLNLALRQLGDD